MPQPTRRSQDCLWTRFGYVNVTVSVRGPVKDALIDIAHDQGRSFSTVLAEALTGYALNHWMREEPISA